MVSPFLTLLCGSTLLAAFIPAIALGIESLLAPLFGQALAQGLTILAGNGGLAVVVSFLLEIAKRWDKFPIVNEYSARITKILAGIAGAMASAGFTTQYDAAVGTFIIAGLTRDGLGAFAVNVIHQLGLQEMAYQWLIKGRR